MKKKIKAKKLWKQFERLVNAIEQLKNVPEITVKVKKDSVAEIEMTKADWATIAYHEIGHAIVTQVLAKNVVIQYIQLGETDTGEKGYNCINQKNHIRKKSDFLDEIAIMLGGLVAEEIMYGQHSDGCYEDLADAKDHISYMLKDCAMGKKLSYTEDYLEDFYVEMEEILQQQKARAEKAINANLKALKGMQKALLKYRKLEQKEVYKLFEKYGV